MKMRKLFAVMLAIMLVVEMMPISAFSEGDNAGGTSGSTANAGTDGYSVYVVRLSYNNNGRHYDFGRNANLWSTWIDIDAIRQKLALPDGEVTNMTSSHPYIIEVRKNSSGVWGVQCRQEQIPDGVYLTVTIDGTTYTIDVGNAPPDTGGNTGNFRWDLYAYERILVISGSGSLPDYEKMSDLPWYSSQNILQEIIIGEGITHVNSTIFRSGSNLITVYLPSSITHISWAGSWDSCPYLNEFVYPGTKAQWQNVSGHNNMPQDKYVRCSDGIYSDIKNNVTLELQSTDSSSNDTVEIEGSTAGIASHVNPTVVVVDIAYGDSVTVKVTTDKRIVESVKLVYQSGAEDSLSMSSHDGTSEFYSFTMPRSAVTLRVTFIATSAHKITTVITGGKGSVKIAPSENAAALKNSYANAQLCVYFTPDEGYQVYGVTVTNLNGNSQVTVGEKSEYYPFIMPDAPIRVEVAFMASFYEVTTDFDAAKGDVKIFGISLTNNVQTDQTVSFRAIPGAGCAIESVCYIWKGNTQSIPVSGQEYSFTMPPADTVVKVVFKEEPGMPVITAAPSELPTGITGDTYRYELQATGEDPITWTWSQGKRGNTREYPPGLSLSTDGLISGTPEMQGTWTDITITATNTKGSASFKTQLVVLQYFTVTAAADPVEGGTVTGSGKYQQGTRYTLTATPNGGYDFIGWYNADGQVLSYHTEYGKPMGWGDETVTAKFARHEDGAPVINTTSLPNGVEKLEYEYVLTAGGDVPVKWSVVQGTFPPGLTLSEDGKISGIPTDWNTYVFTVQAENSKGTAFRQFTLRINSEPSDPIRTVTFKDGDAVIVALVQTVNSGERATKPDPDPTKDGYRFEGWYEDATLNVKFNFDQEITADTTVYAKFVKEHTLGAAIYPAQGGTVTFMKNGSVVTQAAQGDELTVTWTPYSGYVRGVFSLTDENGPVSITPNNTGSPVSSWSFTMPASNVTATARFEAETGFVFAGQSNYLDDERTTIVFMLEGGNASSELAALASLISVVLDNEDTVIFKYNYALNCYILQTLNTEQDPLSPGDHTLTFIFSGNEDYAHCTDNFAFTITTDITDVSLNSDSAKKEYIEGEALDLSDLTLDVTRSGGTNKTVEVTENMVSGFDNSTIGKQTLTVTYKGFTDTYEVEVKAKPVPVTKHTVTYIVANGTWADGTTTPKTEEVEDGHSPSQVPTGMIASDGFEGGVWDSDPSGATISGTTSLTYTFTAKQPPTPPTTYTVTVNNGTTDKSTAEAGETVTLTADTPPTGKQFDKWVVNAGGISLADENAGTTTFTMPSANVEVTATYKDNFVTPPVTTSTISYNLNGGTLNGKTGTVTLFVENGTAITLPAPTREGYTFDYWEGSSYNAGDSYIVNGDHTFTAQWKKNSSTPVTSDPGETSPPTGDESNPDLWLAMMIASLVAMAIVLLGIRKRNSQRNER